MAQELCPGILAGEFRAGYWWLGTESNCQWEDFQLDLAELQRNEISRLRRLCQLNLGSLHLNSG
jgi:hypothetical protein